MKNKEMEKKLRQPSEVILKSGKTLQEVLELHKKWLDNEEGGERANLSGEDLSYVNLRGANLSYANLYGADLTNTKFYSTNLYKAKGDFVGVENIGSRGDTTHYFYKDNRVICGCFSGTMEEFKEKVKETYNEDDREYKEYMMAIEFLKGLAKLYMK